MHRGNLSFLEPALCEYCENWRIKSSVYSRFHRSKTFYRKESL